MKVELGKNLDGTEIADVFGVTTAFWNAVGRLFNGMRFEEREEVEEQDEQRVLELRVLISDSLIEREAG